MSFLAFVIMPYREPFIEIFNEVFSPCLEQKGLLPSLAPNIHGSRDVMSNLYRGIWQSRIVIADLTNLSVNVLYELGIAFTLNKQVILLTQDIQELPFDLRRDKVLIYHDSPVGREKLKEDLRKEVEIVMQRGWTVSPSWKEELNADIFPVNALLDIESRVVKEVWIIEPGESFQDTAFHDVILTNLNRGIIYRFIVNDHIDVEQAFREALDDHYG